MTYSKLFTFLSVCLIVASCRDYGVAPIIIPPISGLSVNDTAVLEGAMITFTITLSEADTVDVAVSWQLVDSSAHAGTDFPVASGNAFIMVGDTSVTVHVNTLNDSIIESGEHCKVILSNSPNAEIGDSIGIITIWDDDGVRYATSIKPILVNNCAFADCHGDGSREGGLDMGDVTYENIRHASGDIGPVIVQGNAESSPLYKVTTPTSLPDVDRMPSGGPYLTTGQQKLIKDWINQGAQDN